MTGQKIDWSDWAIWIVSTVKSLVEKAEAQEKEFFEIQETFLRDLLKLKEELKQDIVNCQNNEKKSLNKVIEGLNKLIDSLSERLVAMEQGKPVELVVAEKITELKDNVIVPLRIRQGVLSACVGGAGGIFTLLVIEFVKRFFE